MRQHLSMIMDYGVLRPIIFNKLAVLYSLCKILSHGVFIGNAKKVQSGALQVKNSLDHEICLPHQVLHINSAKNLYGVI